MDPLPLLASALGRRDEAPNEELASTLASSKDAATIAILADALSTAPAKVQADAIKVLYEVGYQEPKLLVPHIQDFLKAIQAKNNRLVWGGMIALRCVAPFSHPQLAAAFAILTKAVEEGSVITRDAGVGVFAALATPASSVSTKARRVLKELLQSCRPKDVPNYATSIHAVSGAMPPATFRGLLQQRFSELSAAQSKRVERILKQLES